LSQQTFNFCGLDAINDLDLIVNSIRYPVTPEITENTQDVPGMVGKIFLGNSYGQKIFQIDITIMKEDSKRLIQKIHQLTELVMTFGDGEYPMIFSDDPEYTYYGHFTGVSTPDKIGGYATCTLTFACSDPKGYGEYQQKDMTKNPITIYPAGNGECYPIFTCLPKKAVTKIAITDENGTYAYVGADVDPDTGDEPIDKEPLVLHDACNTLATWTEVTNATLTFTLDNGVIGGTMQSTSAAIKVGSKDNFADFGPAVNGKWHGPCRLQWLPNSYSDYRIKVGMYNRQYNPRARGKSEIYLLDSDGERIAHISLKDKGNSEEVMIKVRLKNGGSEKSVYDSYRKIKKGKTITKTIKLGAGTKKVKSKGKTKTVQQWKTVKLDEDTSTSTYTDFYGYIVLEKKGKKFTVEIMKLDDNSNPAWPKPVTATLTDSANTYNQDLAGVAFYTAKYDIDEDRANPIKHYTNNKMALCDVKVWNIIDGGNGASSVPVTIARNGDEIKINCEDRTVYKNGDVFMKHLYIGSEFPTMEGGTSKTFAFEPGLNDADWYWEYRPTTR
jgi:predicted phage tail component-like protein